MENQDIFNQFKKAADNAESPEFASMENVWQRVETKLDQKELKQKTVLWKKWAVAASILLGLSIGYQFLQSDNASIPFQETITLKDSVSSPVKGKPEDVVVSTGSDKPSLKPEADQLLERHIASGGNQVALEENNTYDSYQQADSIAYDVSPSAAAMQGYSQTQINETVAKKSSPKAKNMEMFFNNTKETQDNSTRKEEALIVYDDLVKNKQSLKSVDPDEVESIVVLNDPLYIINGVEYTEQEVFGPNPTSPYSPLKEQQIESVTVLQDEKAIEKYGDKGKKGVVIITTKNGKPAAKKGK